MLVFCSADPKIRGRSSSELQLPQALDLYQIKPNQHIFISSKQTFHSDSSIGLKQNICFQTGSSEGGGNLFNGKFSYQKFS